MAEIADIKMCDEAASQIRKDIIDMTYSVGNMGAHLGGSLSMVEILAVLYKKVVRYNTEDLLWEERDRVILSKGHAALALYPALVQAGILRKENLLDFKKNGSKLSGHPSLNGLPGIEFASGSLGQGLSLGVGVALALNKKGNEHSRVFVLLGDGECDEGSVWEAAASASHFNLSNLVIIIDKNEIQYDGATDSVLSMSPFEMKWKSFGWDVLEVNGHSTKELIDALSYKSKQPLAIIAHTVKGKGITFMEGNKLFHNSRLSDKQYEEAKKELEVC